MFCNGRQMEPTVLRTPSKWNRAFHARPACGTTRFTHPLLRGTVLFPTHPHVEPTVPRAPCVEPPVPRAPPAWHRPFRTRPPCGTTRSTGAPRVEPPVPRVSVAWNRSFHAPPLRANARSKRAPVWNRPCNAHLLTSNADAGKSKSAGLWHTGTPARQMLAAGFTPAEVRDSKWWDLDDDLGWNC